MTFCFYHQTEFLVLEISMKVKLNRAAMCYSVKDVFFDTRYSGAAVRFLGWPYTGLYLFKMIFEARETKMPLSQLYLSGLRVISK